MSNLLWSDKVNETLAELSEDIHNDHTGLIVSVTCVGIQSKIW